MTNGLGKGQDILSWISHFMDRSNQQKRSLRKRIFGSMLISLLGFFFVAFLQSYVADYFSSILIFTSIIVTIYSGLYIGFTLTVILALLADFFFIIPKGQVLSTADEIMRFLFFTGIGFSTSLLIISVQTSLQQSLRAIEKAKWAEHEMEKALKARDAMIGVISHELKNPLTALKLNTNIIQKILPLDPKLDGVRKLVEKFNPPIYRMTRLISDLLDITRIEAKALKLECKLADLSDIVGEVVSMHMESAEENLIELKYEIHPECQYVFCDPERTNQILTNLINNAIKFTNTGGSINIQAMKRNSYVEIRVIDTGKGISSDNLPHVFDRFWQVQETAYKGTGLGLAIVKGLVEAQGGEIWVESQIGNGTTFYFTLPIEKNNIC